MRISSKFSSTRLANLRTMKVFSEKGFIEIRVRKLSSLGMIRGLMFRTRETGNLLFDNFDGAIHSWFVFFPFLGLWLDSNNKILHKEIIKPFESHCKPNTKFSKLVEIPLNNENRQMVEFLVGKERFK